ncbi:hypothetical protein AB0M87_16185 [Streptomyces sp. NPDC051320]|uniref:hypothetical protein n=1 Tax=Streptomyces sp. NPDC051320 TaxID=3154644 RepID=UPI003433BFDB
MIVGRWTDKESYWPGVTPDDTAVAFAPASGPQPLLAAQRRLDQFGARVPRVLLAEAGRRPGGALP